MTKKPVITHELISEWKAATKVAGKLENKIIDRLGYVVNFLFKTFKRRLETWYFVDAPEGGMGEFVYDDHDIWVVTETPGHSYDDMTIIDKDGEVWSFEGIIPTRWLFEDFEQEVVEGKKKYEEQEEARKNTEKNKKLRQKELAQAAKKKLTKEELSALKRTL
jgi:hypothetical protein